MELRRELIPGCQWRDVGTCTEGKNYMTNLRNIQHIWKKRSSDKPLLKSRKRCLLKSVLAVSCRSQHCLALGLIQGISWHELGLTRKLFFLELSVEGKQLRFSLKARLGKVYHKWLCLSKLIKTAWVTINVFSFALSSHFLWSSCSSIIWCLQCREKYLKHIYEATSALQKTPRRWDTNLYIKMRTLLKSHLSQWI